MTPSPVKSFVRFALAALLFLAACSQNNLVEPAVKPADTRAASILVLLQVAQALQCPLAELLGDVTTSSPEWLMIRELLERRDEATLKRVREAVGSLLGTGGANAANAQRSPRVALIGLRGAGKSTLGRLLAEALEIPFVELSREIERIARAGRELRIVR